MSEKNKRSVKQELFRELVLGTLVYSVVLGFFNDYSEIIHTGTYSTTFLVAVVLEILTYITFWLKGLVVNKFKGKEDSRYKVALVIGVWLIMFLSKFVFLAAIDFIFGGNVKVSGFIGLIIIILLMTLAKKFIDIVYEKLA